MLILLFQLIFTLATIQNVFPYFRHNDLHVGNVVYKQIPAGGSYCYKIGNMIFQIPNIGIRLMIFDFDYSCIPGVIDNEKLPNLWAPEYNISDAPLNSYDIDFILYSILNEAKQMRLVNLQLVLERLLKGIPFSKNARPSTDEQFKSPLQLLADEQFNFFRIPTDKGNFIEIFDANQKFQNLNTETLMNQFTKCFTSTIMLPKDRTLKNMAAYVAAKFCNTEKPIELKDMSAKLNSNFRGKFVNNFTQDKITKNDIQPLINFILDDLCKNNFFYSNLDLEELKKVVLEAVTFKVYVYFFEEIPYTFLKNYTDQEDRFLYNQILIDKTLVERYFRSKQNPSKINLIEEKVIPDKTDVQIRPSTESKEEKDILDLIQKVYDDDPIKGMKLDEKILALWNEKTKLTKSAIEKIRRDDLPLSVIMNKLKDNGPLYSVLVRKSKNLINEFLI